MTAASPEEPEATRRRWEGVIRVQKPGPAGTVRSAAQFEAEQEVEEAPAAPRRAPTWAVAPAEWTAALPQFTALHTVDCPRSGPVRAEESEPVAHDQATGRRTEGVDLSMAQRHAAAVVHAEQHAVQRQAAEEAAEPQVAEPDPARQRADLSDTGAVGVVPVEAIESKVVEVVTCVPPVDVAEAAEAAEAVEIVQTVEVEAEPVRVVRDPAARPPAPRTAPVMTSTPQEARVPASRREPDPLVSTSIGARLAAARQSAGLTHEQLARITRIGVGRLVEFENDDYSGCGDGVFARGRLDSIARAVGVDPGPLLQEFDSRQGRGAPRSSAQAGLRQLVRMPRNWATVLLVVLALAAVYPVGLLVVAVLG